MLLCTFIGVPELQTVNQYHYLHVFDEIRERIRKKRPELRDKSSVQGNGPAHSALFAKGFLDKYSILV
ncbi:hypothetical protein TNCV_4668001 [Trichonephila clavipes]|nr:hypothetical protein TNCV_4668001 [Trichonephila clavipes]